MRVFCGFWSCCSDAEVVHSPKVTSRAEAPPPATMSNSASASAPRTSQQDEMSDSGLSAVLEFATSLARQAGQMIKHASENRRKRTAGTDGTKKNSVDRESESRGLDPSDQRHLARVCRLRSDGGEETRAGGEGRHNIVGSVLWADWCLK